jgi:gliding motility-associated-like protein
LLDTANYNSPFSIALYKDTLYTNDPSGNLYQSVVGTNSYRVLLTNQAYTDSLTVDKTGNLFWVSYENNLFTYNPYTNKIRDFGTLNFTPSGDLIFYQDKLLMSSIDGKFIEINIGRPEQSFSLMETRGHSFYGLANINEDCTQHYIFGFESSANGTNVVEIDMDKKKVVGTYCTLPFMINDAASEKEYGGYDCICHFYIPNAFSPNHDGLNDTFRPIIRCSPNIFVMGYIFRVFNRWGQLIFSSQDTNQGWTGGFSGQQQPQGIYVWELNYKNDVSGNITTQKGSFMLLR